MDSSIWRWGDADHQCMQQTNSGGKNKLKIFTALWIRIRNPSNRDRIACTCAYYRSCPVFLLATCISFFFFPVGLGLNVMVPCHRCFSVFFSSPHACRCLALGLSRSCSYICRVRVSCKLFESGTRLPFVWCSAVVSGLYANSHLSHVIMSSGCGLVWKTNVVFTFAFAKTASWTIEQVSKEHEKNW